jgi:hypothetical protein
MTVKEKAQYISGMLQQGHDAISSELICSKQEQIALDKEYELAEQYLKELVPEYNE